jgi:hypothetical protein
MYSTGKLRAGTYGRGIWETDVTITTMQTMQNISSLETSVVPNPSAGESSLIIKTTCSDEVTVHVYNVIGELVWTAEQDPSGNNTRIELPVLTSGSYIARVVQNDQVSASRFIIR